MMRGAPLGSIGAAHQSGWSNEHIFLKFLNHFIDHSKPTIEDPVILLLDNHESHMAIPVIDRAKDAGVILVTFYPHTTHKMQPLDRTVFGPFKTFFNKAAHEFLITPGPNGNKRSMTIYDVAAVADKAYKQSFTPTNIVSGFQVCGLFPLNTDIFPDHEFINGGMPADNNSLVLNQQEMSENDKRSLSPEPEESETQNRAPSVSTPQASSRNSQLALDCQTTTPQTSGTNSPVVPDHQTPSQTSNHSCQVFPTCRTTPDAIRPLPTGNVSTSKRGRAAQKGKARVLTDTPEKNEIEKRKRNGGKPQNQPKKKQRNAPKKKLFPDETSEDEDVEYSDESRDDITSFRNKILAEELENNIDCDDIKVGDFVFIKLSTKKISKFFVGRVHSKDSDDSFSVKYLKKAKSIGKEYFTFIEDSEIYEILAEDIVLKLPQPELIAGSSSRSIEKYVFPVDLEGFDLG